MGEGRVPSVQFAPPPEAVGSDPIVNAEVHYQDDPYVNEHYHSYSYPLAQPEVHWMDEFNDTHYDDQYYDEEEYEY
jgi:hypothetical protein